MKSFLNENLIDEFHLYTSSSSNEKLDVKNPFSATKKWQVKDERLFDNDQLIILLSDTTSNQLSFNLNLYYNNWLMSLIDSSIESNLLTNASGFSVYHFI